MPLTIKTKEVNIFKFYFRLFRMTEPLLYIKGHSLLAESNNIYLFYLGLIIFKFYV